MPLVKALYGHPQAGVFWERRLHAAVLEGGFTSLGTCGEWRSVYFHYELRVLMIVYVDDFKMSCPPAAVREAWRKIQAVKVQEEDGSYTEAIKLGDVEDVNTFLGCGHHTETFQTQSGVPGKVMVWQMHKFMRSCVERYEEVARGADPKYELQPCHAPFINEDELPNPARTGLRNSDGSTHGFVCLYCTEAFATQDFTPVKTPQEAAKVCKDLRNSQASLRYGSSLTLAGNERNDGTIAALGVLAVVACSVIIRCSTGHASCASTSCVRSHFLHKP